MALVRGLSHLDTPGRQFVQASLTQAKFRVTGRRDISLAIHGVTRRLNEERKFAQRHLTPCQLWVA
jgi:hypothetical protein